MATTTLKDCVIHYRKKLERNTDEDVILSAVRKLSRMPITMELVEETGICKTLQTKSKEPGKVGTVADALLKQWRLKLASSIKLNDKQNKQHNGTKESKHESNKHSKEHRHIKNNSKSSNSVSKVDKNNCASSESNSNSHNSEKKKYIDSEIYDPESVGVLHEKVKKLCQDEIYEPSVVKKKDFNKANHRTKPVNNVHNSSSEDMYIPSLKRDETDRKNKLHSKCSSLLEGVYEPSALKRKHTEENGESNTNSIHNPTSKHSIQASVVERVDELPVIKKKDNKEMKEVKKLKKGKSTSKDSESVTDSSKRKDKSNHSKKSHSSDKKSLKLSSGSKELKHSSLEVSKPPKNVKIKSAEEFTSSEARFEDCLGFNDIVVKKKKKFKKPVPESSKTSPSTAKSKNEVPQKKSRESQKVTNNDSSKKAKKSSSSSSSPSPLSFEILPKPEKELIDVDIMSTLPQTIPSYRPLPQRTIDGSPLGKKKVLSNEEAIKFTSSRREKTAVYSGRKNFFSTDVPTLFHLCIQFLIENINNIEQMRGSVPYHVIKPVLERCSAAQLFAIENYNSYLLEDTDQLWEVHCKRDYKREQPGECETWREVYLRAQDEREMKLKNITANISASMHKSNPVRQVKLAYVDSVVKPPRDVARRQAKHGTGLPVNHPVKAGPPSKASPRPVAPVINTSSSSPSSSTSASTTTTPPFIIPPKKPKVAPLMAKTLKSMKACFRRK